MPSTKPLTTCTCATGEVAALHRSAMSYLLLAAMELQRLDGVSDTAYEFADKALNAIGTLRVLSIGGRG